MMILWMLVLLMILKVGLALRTSYIAYSFPIIFSDVLRHLPAEDSDYNPAEDEPRGRLPKYGCTVATSSEERPRRRPRKLLRLENMSLDMPGGEGAGKQQPCSGLKQGVVLLKPQ